MSKDDPKTQEEYLQLELQKLRRILPEAEDSLNRYEQAVSNNEENTSEFLANFRINTMSYYIKN